MCENTPYPATPVERELQKEITKQRKRKPVNTAALALLYEALAQEIVRTYDDVVRTSNRTKKLSEAAKLAQDALSYWEPPFDQSQRERCYALHSLIADSDIDPGAHYLAAAENAPDELRRAKALRLSGAVCLRDGNIGQAKERLELALKCLEACQHTPNLGLIQECDLLSCLLAATKIDSLSNVACAAQALLERLSSAKGGS